MDTGAVPADGQSVVYLLNLSLGSRVIVKGPDPESFAVTDDTVALAFIIPGYYTITVVPLDGGSVARLEIEATPPGDGPEQDFLWIGGAPPIPPRKP